LQKAQNFYTLIFKDNTEKMSSKKWISIFVVTTVFGLIPYLISYVYLKSVYEHNGFDDIVKRQIKNDSIYGTALNQNTFKYKLELIKQRKPKIIALGSSRVMQFREQFFNVQFVTAGGAMNYLSEGEVFIDELLNDHKPEYIILGLDFWWFNENTSQLNKFLYHDNDGKTMDLKKLIKPYSYLIGGKSDLSTIKFVFDNDEITNSYTKYDNLGLRAISTSTGFRKDGSYFYSNSIFGLGESEGKFLDTIDRVRKGDRRFEYGDHISQERIKSFTKLVDKINSNNIKLIILIPPIANAIHIIMDKTNKYNYIGEFIDYVSALKIPTFNYHDLSVLTTNDCECIDGFHGGDVVYQRILLDIFNSNKDPYFNSLLDIDTIKYNIKKFNGKVLTVNDNEEFTKKEVDFLQIGCNK